MTFKNNAVFIKNFPIRCCHFKKLIQAAHCSSKGHARLCIHPSTRSPVQQMLLCVTNKARFYYHRHKKSFKSYILLHGEILFLQEKKNKVLKKRYLFKKNPIIIYIDSSIWHTYMSLSSYSLLLETKQGPFKKCHIKWKPLDFNI